jgi:hypothetical protein
MKRSSIWSLVAAALLVVAAVWVIQGKGAEEAAGSNRESSAGTSETKSETTRPQARKRETRMARKPANDAVENIRVKDTYENRLAGDLLRPFDPEELRRLAEDPGRSGRRFLELLLRAAADRDASFRHLLDRPELRDDPQAELGLLTYDYAVTGNREALEKILKLHVEAPVGRRTWDSNEIMALAVIGEWDLTRKALVSHCLSGDGSGGDAQYAFWLKRRFLFPRDPGFPQTFEAFGKEMLEEQKKNDPRGNW